MRVIRCKEGKAFAGHVLKYVDAEWKLQEAYYVAQGCTVSTEKEFGFEKCECEHHKALEHNFEELIEEIKSKT